MTVHAVRGFESHSLRQPSGKEHGFDFATLDGQATFPRAAWRTALETASVDDFTFHDCRHTAASYLAMSGATLAEIAEVLGHRTLAMVRRYTHLTESHTLKVARRMAERILS